MNTHWDIPQGVVDAFAQLTDLQKECVRTAVEGTEITFHDPANMLMDHNTNRNRVLSAIKEQIARIKRVESNSYNRHRNSGGNTTNLAFNSHQEHQDQSNEADELLETDLNKTNTGEATTIDGNGPNLSTSSVSETAPILQSFTSVNSNKDHQTEQHTPNQALSDSSRKKPEIPATLQGDRSLSHGIGTLPKASSSAPPTGRPVFLSKKRQALLDQQFASLKSESEAVWIPGNTIRLLHPAVHIMHYIQLGFSYDIDNAGPLSRLPKLRPQPRGCNDSSWYC